jgi:ATP-dependent exoDNAse (exonuclease V) alpha subunit
VHADAARAKVVLVGDDQQLPEIGVGGAFSSLVRRLPAFVLAENRRQHDPDERRALTELRTGNAAAAVERMITNGRIAFVESVEGAREEMVRDWMRAYRAGEDVVMLAFGRADVRELNALARDQLVDEGTINNTGERFSVGDRVMSLGNRKWLGIVNGARGSVVADDGGLTVRFDDGTTVDLPPSYIEAGHLAHAYASTIHKAQGMSCDRAFVLGSGALFREAGYTALSRGRKENRLYVVAPEPPDVDVGHGVYGARDDPVDDLVRALEHSQRKHLAVDRLVRASPSRLPELDAPSIGIEP